MTKKINDQIVVIKNWCLQANYGICQIHQGHSLCVNLLWLDLWAGCPLFQFEILTHKPRGTWIFLMLPCESRNQPQSECRSFAEQLGEQSQNFPHTWIELWVCNKAESWPSFSWLCYQAFCTDLLFSALFYYFFSFRTEPLRKKRFVEGEERMKKKQGCVFAWKREMQHCSNGYHCTATNRLRASNVGQLRGRGKKRKEKKKTKKTAGVLFVLAG